MSGSPNEVIPEKGASCAVVVPVYQAALTDDERTSIAHLRKHLAHLDIYVLAPEGLRIDALPFRYLDQDPEHFASRDSYSKLLLSEAFYRQFAAYEYILIYQLDCLVFSSDVERWTSLGYDYLGAPLFKDMSNPAMGFSRVGNGGLSLRKTSAFLRVIISTRYSGGFAMMAFDFLFTALPDIAHKGMFERMKNKLRILRNVAAGAQAYRERYTLNEDLFWSDRAQLYYPSFRIAPIADGLAFAFEQFPDYCLAQNNGELPFGCHAWSKWDRAFWTPYLIQE